MTQSELLLVLATEAGPERIGTPQAIIFRGKTIEEIVEQYNKFNKEHRNIEHDSFAIFSEVMKDMAEIEETETEDPQLRGKITRVKGKETHIQTSENYYGFYQYIEYITPGEKSKFSFRGGFG